ncbi:MAG TPA: hypothetical protein VGM51_15295 [Armatimonadota bacterium]|jgi:hypothetical protein
MKTDLATKALLVFMGSGMWALALTHWQAPVVTAQAAAQSAVQDVVRTQRLEVVDANGKVRVSISPQTYGYLLSMDDEKGKKRVGLFAGNDGSLLSLMDETGKTRAVLGTADSTPTTLRLTNEKGKTVFEQPRPAWMDAKPNPYREYR